jgi:hypothetical protein
MRTRLLCQALLVTGLCGSVFGSLSVPCLAQADAAPFAAQPFVQDGVASHVDTDRDRVAFDGGDGRTYTLDTATTEITLLNGKQGGITSDLTPGMRLHVSGKRISAEIIEAETVHILAPQAPPVADGADIHLRGTVDSIDTRLGAFVVRVSTHTRTIYLADDTDLTGMALHDPNRFPVKPGDRVSVAGRLQPDGSVLAGAVSLSKTIIVPPPATLHAGQIIFGRISSVSNRYTSRDIKIVLADDREVKVKVRRGLSIRRDGRAISVHDLHTEDNVRVLGDYDGTDFKAERIDVLHRDTPEEPSTAARRGL